MRFVPAREHHYQWIKARTGLVRVEDERGIAAELDGKIIGVCVLHSWTQTSVQVHIAIDNPICLKGGRFQKEISGYIFNTAGRKMAIGLVPASNHKALRFDRKLGFAEVARIPDGYEDGVDMVILMLHKDGYHGR